MRAHHARGDSVMPAGGLASAARSCFRVRVRARARARLRVGVGVRFRVRGEGERAATRP